MAFRKPGSGIQHRAWREWDRRYHSLESQRVGPFEIMDDVIAKYRLRPETAAWLEGKIDLTIPHERPSMRNPAVSASWPRMTSRQRAAALEFAGVGEDRARAYAMASWSDLSSEAKSALLRGWHMATIGGTTRRYRDTTRRIPVLTNPTDGWAVTQDSETLKQFGPGTKGANAAFAWLHKRQGNSVDWAVQYSGYDMVNVEGGKVVYSYKKSGLKKLTNRSRRNGTKGAYPFKEKVAQYRKYTMDQLIYARNDATEAARTMKGGDVAAENWYKDDYFTISDEITRRRHGLKNSKMNPDIPDWIRSDEKFYSKFGTTIGRFQNAIKRLSKTKQKRLHQMLGKGVTEAAVKWVLKEGGMSVSANPVTKPYQVWGSHTYVQSIGRGGWKIYATYRTPRHAREDAEGIMKFGIPSVKGKVQALLLHASSGGFSVYWRPVRKVASNAWHPMKAETVERRRTEHAERQRQRRADLIKRLEEKAKRDPGGDWLEVIKEIRAQRNPAEAPRIWRKRRRGKRTTHFKGADPRYRTYYVALVSRSYPGKGRYWTASTVVDALPPTVVGKLYKISARSKVAAIKEARGF